MTRATDSISRSSRKVASRAPVVPPPEVSPRLRPSVLLPRSEAAPAPPKAAVRSLPLLSLILKESADADFHTDSSDDSEETPAAKKAKASRKIK